MPEPYFKGAAVPDFLKGLAYGTSTFTFVADEAGDYALACGFPAHALNGHWIALEISGTATAPTLKLGTGEPKPAGPAPASTSAAPGLMAGKKCPECGAHAVIKRDGCEQCTSCGYLGACG